MTLSPAQRIQARKRAAREAGAMPVAGGLMQQGATRYELYLAQLAQDRLRLKQIQSAQGKAELKRRLLPNYEPYVSGVLSAGRGTADEVLTTLMVWYLDAGDYSGALKVAAYVLRHNLPMPDRFARTTGCLVAEEVAEIALKAQKAGGRFPTEILIETEELTSSHDMPDEARAKLHLALGRALETACEDNFSLEQLERARQHIARAIDLHGSCGGKKDMERVERTLKKQAVPPAN